MNWECVMGCTRLCMVLCCSVLVYIGLYWFISAYTGLYESMLVCVGLCWFVLVYIGLYWSGLIYTG